MGIEPMLFGLPNVIPLDYGYQFVILGYVYQLSYIFGGSGHIRGANLLIHHFHPSDHKVRGFLINCSYH